MDQDATSKTASLSKQVSVSHATRGADHNRDLIKQSDQGGENILLPSLEAGVTLLDIDGGRGVPVLQSLVLDHLLMHDGPAFWVDANGHATTTILARLTPSQRLLDRIHVARGFTAYQHYGAVCDLQTAVNQSIQKSTADDGMHRHRSSGDDGESSQHTPSLIVVPAIDTLYRTDDTLGQRHAKTLQARTLAQVTTYAEGYDVPVLVTRTTTDTFTSPVETVADQHLKCEQTKLGPRFVGDEFETLVYPVENGTHYQTTFGYWRQLLAVRAWQGRQESVSPAPKSGASDDIGTGVTVHGETQPLTTDPLLDAWTAVSAGER
ncbi:hypothetical protein [Haloarcula sp. CGMCC 1.2071]|uniref:hypothetical protein n=1 Tax=Haloarcula sp. CGMCC 1.2071 TaxID=3111454 RepID=UPI003FA5AAD7